MKRFIFAILCALIIISVAFISYCKTYRVADNKKQLEDSIKQFINRPTETVNNIDVRQQLNIDNKKYVLYTIDNKTLGDAELTKGINNKYKIVTTVSGRGFFDTNMYKTNRGKYLVFKGENYDLKIAYLKVTIDNKAYKINIPQQEYFLVSCPIPTKTQDMYIDFNKVKLYNKNDVDISNEMFKVL